jgi:hypothetical protein
VKQDWITTSQANRILNIGICDRTFREKMREALPWQLTPGGQIRWSRAAVEALAQMGEAPATAA